jgi:hypothetical protein
MTGFMRWLGVLLALPGVAAILLPFTAGVSPLRVVMDAVGLDFRGSAADYIWLAIPFFVAIPTLDWQIARARATRIGWKRVFVGHAVAVAAIASVLVTALQSASESLAEAWPFLLPALAAVVVWGALVARAFRRKRPADEIVGVSMNSAYLPNAILCLVVFRGAGMFNGWQVGAWVTLVACVCAVIHIVLVMESRATDNLKAAAKTSPMPHQDRKSSHTLSR